MPVSKRAEKIIVEYLENNTRLDGQETREFAREMKKRGVFESVIWKR